MFRTDNHAAWLSQKRRPRLPLAQCRRVAILYSQPFRHWPPVRAKSRQQYFIRTRALRRLMASATPPEIRRAGGVNRWTLEPLLIVLPWIFGTRLHLPRYRARNGRVGRGACRRCDSFSLGRSGGGLVSSAKCEKPALTSRQSP